MHIDDPADDDQGGADLHDPDAVVSATNSSEDTQSYEEEEF